MNKMEIIMECGTYSGDLSQERCKIVEQYTKNGIRSSCRVEKLKLIETEIQSNLIQPTLVLRYHDAKPKRLIKLLDKLLSEVNIVAIRVVVTKIVTKLVEGALAGAGAGAGYISSKSKNSKDIADALIFTLMGALISAFIGGLIGNSKERRINESVALKESGEWVFGEIRNK